MVGVKEKERIVREEAEIFANFVLMLGGEKR